MDVYLEEKDGQVAFDTRLDTEKSLQENVSAATEFACRQLASMNVPKVTSRHDGYGIASEYYAALRRALKAVDQNMKDFLNILSADDIKAIDVVSSLKNSAEQATLAAVNLTAEADKIMNDLYEEAGTYKTPLEEYAEEISEDNYEETENEDSEEAEQEE